MYLFFNSFIKLGGNRSTRKKPVVRLVKEKQKLIGPSTRVSTQSSSFPHAFSTAVEPLPHPRHEKVHVLFESLPSVPGFRWWNTIFFILFFLHFIKFWGKWSTWNKPMVWSYLLPLEDHPECFGYCLKRCSEEPISFFLGQVLLQGINELIKKDFFLRYQVFSDYPFGVQMLLHSLGDILHLSNCEDGNVMPCHLCHQLLFQCQVNGINYMLGYRIRPGYSE